MNKNDMKTLIVNLTSADIEVSRLENELRKSGKGITYTSLCRLLEIMHISLATNVQNLRTTLDKDVVIDMTQCYPHTAGYTDKLSALHSLMHDIATEYPFLMIYRDKNEILTYFATLLMNYSNHDKRDVELRLEEVEPLYKLRWCLIADHEILDCGDYIIDKDVPF